jgi:hypothetical protein
MKRKRLLIFIFSMVMCMSAAGVYSNAIINSKHAGMKARDGKAINCGYCHGAIAKQKGQNLMKGQAKYRSLAQKPSCGGGGCHR